MEGRCDKTEGKRRVKERKFNEGMKFFRLTFQQKSTLMNGALANIALNGCYSIAQSFMRDEAIKKDVSLTGVGAIFGCYEVAMFCCSFIIGSQLCRMGARRCFYIGTLVIGVSSLAFGFLGSCPPGGTFLGLAITIRVIESLGAAISAIAIYALATKEFRDNVATAYGFLEMFAGLGHVLGPLVGGGLYQLGGFGLPFFVSGPLTIIVAAVAFFTLPTEKEEEGNLSELFLS
ncbi:MFS-type transporter SLC18B1 [Lingula anatina]|uniref:MFS-type transporter SLC18B1 n=1 Tax=Lingula anatina TaxID=7574 RepID=A0A1S3H4T4_LINAN|nr:MFS-type transporter SLC18B1 [Lingula anatina]|eukprot:XP_013380476.1 MFS-type transporter SLC18B1 [Lingula anatina]